MPLHVEWFFKILYVDFIGKLSSRTILVHIVGFSYTAPSAKRLTTTHAYNTRAIRFLCTFSAKHQIERESTLIDSPRVYRLRRSLADGRGVLGGTTEIRVASLAGIRFRQEDHGGTRSGRSRAVGRRLQRADLEVQRRPGRDIRHAGRVQRGRVEHPVVDDGEQAVQRRRQRAQGPTGAVDRAVREHRHGGRPVQPVPVLEVHRPRGVRVQVVRQHPPTSVGVPQGGTRQPQGDVRFESTARPDGRVLTNVALARQKRQLFR